MRRGLSRLWRNLRFKLVVLVLLAVVPGLALNIVIAQNLRSSTVDAIVSQAQMLANTISVFQQTRVRETENLLEGFSTEAFLRNLDIEGGQLAECQNYFRDTLDHFPQYANVGVLDSQGILVCNGLGTSPGLDESNRLYYRDAFASKGFSVGDYQIDSSTGLPEISLAYPVFDGDGNVIRVVFAAVLAGTMDDFIVSLDLPDSSTVTVADENGTVLSRVPPDPEITGNTQLVQPAIAALRSGKPAIYLEGFGQPGQREIVVSTEIPLVGDVRSGFVFLSIPESVVFSDVSRITRITNLSLLGFLVIAVGLAFFSVDAAVIKPIRKLILAANRLSTGDLSSRTGLRHGPDEIGQLANSFDGMASALEQRELEITQVESRLSTMLANIDEGIVSCAPDRTIRLFNKGAERMFGYSAEAITWRVVRQPV